MNPIDYIRNDALTCNWDKAQYLVFSNEVEPLLYYSHLFPAFAILILALIVIFRNHKALSAKIFFSVAILFVLYSVFDLILWATERPSLIMFFWSLLTYIEPLIYAGMLYLVLVLIKNSDVSLKIKYTAGALLLPIIVLGPTNLNIAGFDYTNCWRLATEGPLLTYVYFIEALIAIWILVAILIEKGKTTDPRRKKMLLYLLSGSILFLVSFSLGNILGTFFQDALGEEAWEIGQYGFFGMPVFLGFLMYLMVEFKIFAARVMYAEALVLSLFIAILSLLLVPDIYTARPIIAITSVLTFILGFILIQGIKKDIKQKEKIESLATNLESANDRLKELDKLKSEFVSIASHQLRSPLTSIRGYSSLLLDGSYGKMPAQAIEPLTRIDHSSKLMAISIEDYLNVSRIESGNMKYINSDFNLVDEVEQVCDGLRTEAVKKGLALIFRTDLKSRGIINADIGKTVQIIGNLVNNSLKYTPQGSIKVLVRDDVVRKKIYVDIMDTGIGMSEKTLNTVFQKFERAENANSVNSSGTGLGLYVALRMAEGMGGTITAHSEGDGKGSRFTFEYPLAL